MPYKIYRPRVERLLRGDFRTDDLSSLFLFLRFHSYGGRCLEEIGDFVAHRDQREKGPVTQELRDWFTAFAFHIPALPSGYNLESLPGDVDEYLDATIRRINWGDLRKRSRLKRADVEPLLKEIKEHFFPNKDGTVALSRSVSDKGMRLFEYLVTHVSVKPLFSAERLFSEFATALQKNKLLHKSELNTLRSHSSLINLYALSVMNGCRIQFHNQNTSRLCAHAMKEDRIEILAFVRVPRPRPGGPPVPIGQTIFTTKLQAPDYCEPELLEKHAWDNYALEVTANGKLGAI